MVADEVYELLTELANCRSVDPSAEEQLITSIVVVTDDLCARVAQRHCRYPGLDWSRDADDLVSLVRETEIAILAGIASGDEDALACVPGFESALFVRGRSAIRSYADSVAATGISGYTGVRRRQHALIQHQRDIQAAGIDPLSTSELIADWNEMVSSTRKNPQKQGCFAVEADIVSPVRVYPRDPQDLSSIPGNITSTADVEMDDVIARTIAWCQAESDILGQVAKLWLAWYPDGEQMSPKAIAEQLHLSAPGASSRISRVRKMFKRALSED